LSEGESPERERIQLKIAKGLGITNAIASNVSGKNIRLKYRVRRKRIREEEKEKKKEDPSA